VAVIAIGYRAPEQGVAAASAAPLANSATLTGDRPAVNDVIANDIAASVAAASNMAIAPKVAERAISTRIETDYSSSDVTSSISKPAIVQLSEASRKITQYPVVAGDTVDSVAAKFGITSNTVKWANNLTANTLAAGSTIDILPRDGIAYIVKASDTIQSLADKYKADSSLIVTYNDLEISGLTAGLKIVIPGAQLPNTERPGYVAPVASFGYSSGYSAGFNGKTWRIKIGTPMYAGNTYYKGNCTAYAFDRRVELGLQVSAGWGNASTWDNGARSARLSVSNTPTVGAIMQNEGGYGHVAIVEKILANGDIEVSEMNASVSGGGWNIVSGRTISSSSVHQYAYIR